MAQESTHAIDAEALGGERTGECATARASGLGRALTVDGLAFDNRVFLAPLSGISDVPFRRLARRFGAGMVVSEMVASAEFVHGHPESALRAMRDGQGLHVVQLAGRDPAWMEAAARKLADLGTDAIDINMGCPAKKVVGGLSGSALMREPELALRIVEAVVAGAGGVPVTLKMRLGWDEHCLNAAEIALRAEGAGVRMITVHGRTRAQFYTGKADWRAISAIVSAVSVPVVANGDLVQASQHDAMLAESRADAVMVGRGAQGRPWFPGLLAGRTDRSALAGMGLAELVVEHYESMLRHYGEVVGLRSARKHLGWYLDRFQDAGAGQAASDRAALMRSCDPVAVCRLLRHLLAGTSIADVEFAENPVQSKAA